MAYAALICLKQTIDRFLNSHHSNLPLNREISFVYEKVKSLQAFLERNLTLESSSSSTSDGRIIDAIHKLEDVLESHVSDQFLSESESLENQSHALVDQEIKSFVETVKKIKEEYDREVSPPSSPLPDGYVSSRINFGEAKTNEMVGLDDEFVNLKYRLIEGSLWLEIVPVFGIIGIGKTTLARKVYQDPLVLSHFDYRLWISIGPKYSVDNLLFDVLFQMDHDNIDEIREKSDDYLKQYLLKIIMGRRYLIVLDDIWTSNVCEYLRRALPEDHNGSRIMITTRIAEVADHASIYGYFHQIRFLTKDESWDLLKKKVFTEKQCPTELEKIGRKIAENCQGLPLAIITIEKLLSKSEKTLEYWKTVAKDDDLYVTAADDDTKVSMVLHLSYKHLPEHIKACFLYMGVFPENYEILASKLVLLWIAEGFVELQNGKSTDDVAKEILEKLVSSGLVLICKRSSRGGITSCTVHYMVRHLCVNEAKKNKYVHIVNSCHRNFPEGANNYQRRLCIHKNILFGIKDVHKSMASVSSARSLLCISPYHQYLLRVCLCFRLLRVLDALTIRFHKFPDEILKLVQLRYLGFTYSGGDLPASISRLEKLQIFIVRWSMSIKSAGAISYLPMEIWKMCELTHLQLMGSDLPDPSDECAYLPNLIELSNVSAHSCTRDVLSRIRNLKKLGIRIELAPDAAEPLCHHLIFLGTLYQLESFKCVVTNPNLQPATLLDSFSNLPLSLRKLTLSGCGFSWKDMRIVSRLPNLEVLKLQRYSFQGPEWAPYEGEFLQLRFLLLEDLDVQHWKADSVIFPRLKHVIIRHCYKLEKIPLYLGKIPTLHTIELVDCNHSAVASAYCIQEEQLSNENGRIQFRFHSSWDDENLKS